MCVLIPLLYTFVLLIVIDIIIIIIIIVIIKFIWVTIYLFFIFIFVFIYFYIYLFIYLFSLLLFVWSGGLFGEEGVLLVGFLTLGCCELKELRGTQPCIYNPSIQPSLKCLVINGMVNSCYGPYCL